MVYSKVQVRPVALPAASQRAALFRRTPEFRWLPPFGGALVCALAKTVSVLAISRTANSFQERP
jgi:hypothetical protein